MMIDGKSMREIAGELKITERAVADRLKSVAAEVSEVMEFKRNNWLLFTIERTEAAMAVIMAQIRKYQGDTDAEIDWRVFDQMRSIIKTQEEAIGLVSGRKDAPNNGNGQTNQINVFVPSIVGGSTLHKMGVAREQQIVSGHVMPQLEDYVTGNEDLYDKLTVDEDAITESSDDGDANFFGEDL